MSARQVKVWSPAENIRKPETNFHSISKNDHQHFRRSRRKRLRNVLEKLSLGRSAHSHSFDSNIPIDSKVNICLRTKFPSNTIRNDMEKTWKNLHLHTKFTQSHSIRHETPTSNQTCFTIYFNRFGSGRGAEMRKILDKYPFRKQVQSMQILKSENFQSTPKQIIVFQPVSTTNSPKCQQNAPK